jgi:predicted dehydrogenase
MSDQVRLLIVGTGWMARNHAKYFCAVPGVSIVAGVDVDSERLAAYCTANNIVYQFATLDEAIAWGDFDAASNATPDNVHYASTMQLMEAGKHVFCEKPLATNYEDAAAMAEAAETRGLVGMVNLSYRNVPALQRAREFVLAGEIGAVRHVEASYLQSWLTSNQWGDWKTSPTWLWRLSRRHGSNGVLGDIGIHILDFTSYGTAAEITNVSCRLKTFHKTPDDQIGEYRLDANDSFVMAVEFDNGALGVIHATRMATGYVDDLQLRIFGDRGALEVSFGYEKPALERVSRLRACLGEARHTQDWTEIPLDPVETNYERFIRAVREKHTLEPSFHHAANLQRLLDQGLAAERSVPGETSLANA